MKLEFIKAEWCEGVGKGEARLVFKVVRQESGKAGRQKDGTGGRRKVVGRSEYILRAHLPLLHRFEPYTSSDDDSAKAFKSISFTRIPRIQHRSSGHGKPTPYTRREPVILLVKSVTCLSIWLVGRILGVSKLAEDCYDVFISHRRVSCRVPRSKNGCDFLKVQSSVSVKNADDNGLDAIQIVPEVPLEERIVRWRRGEDIIS